MSKLSIEAEGSSVYASKFLGKLSAKCLLVSEPSQIINAATCEIRHLSIAQREKAN